MPDPVKRIIAYKADDIDALATLERTCERDEANLFANVESVQRAKVGADKVTAVTYKQVNNFDMGHLTFVQYKNEVDKQSLKAIHTAQGETFICEGEAFVKDKAVLVLVFREKPA